MRRILFNCLSLLTFCIGAFAQNVSNIKVSFGDKVMNVPAASVSGIAPIYANSKMFELEHEKVSNEHLLPDFIAKDNNVSIYWSALLATGIDKKMRKRNDMNYNASLYPAMNIVVGSRIPELFYAPERKLFGFTAFLMTDKSLKEKYGITSLQELATFAKSIYDKTYPEDAGKYDNDYTNPKNPLNRFMAYHILDRNVQGYIFLTVREDAGIDTNIVNPTEWYTTLLPYTMLKVERLTVAKFTGAGDVSGECYLNRRYDNNCYEKGTHVSPSVESEYDNIAINGIYFYIDDVLKFDDRTRDVVDNTRIRMDFSTLFPELQTCNIRMNGNSIGSDNRGMNYYFPEGYLDKVKINEGTFVYTYPKPMYYSLHGDEMNASGLYDIEFQLPPVPFSGEWQLRLGTDLMGPADGATCGQMKVYVDGNEVSLMDLSENLSSYSIYGANSFPQYSQIRNDAEARITDFNRLKNKSVYRAPYSCYISQNGKTSTMSSRLSDIRNMARKVLCTTYLTAGTTHTIRLQNATTLMPARANAVLDYLELVPKSVYAGVEDDL